MNISHKQNLVVVASLTLLLSQSTAGSALPGLGLLKKDKPAAKTNAKPAAKAEVKPVAKAVKTTEVAKDQPIVSERLKAAAQNLLAARKQVSVAQAQLKAAEAEYRVAKFELGAISLRKQANNMANSSGKSEIAQKSTETSATNERIEAPASLGMGDLMPSPASAKPALAPAPGWDKPSNDEVSIDDLDLP